MGLLRVVPFSALLSAQQLESPGTCERAEPDRGLIEERVHP
jgi:hypothetical protein